MGDFVAEAVAAARPIVESIMPDSCQILRPQAAPSEPDDEGGWAGGGLQQVGTAICSYEQAEAEEVIAAGQAGVRIEWLVSLPYQTDVRHEDTLIINASLAIAVTKVFKGGSYPVDVTVGGVTTQVPEVEG